jgi:hypothetical protein
MWHSFPFSVRCRLLLTALIAVFSSGTTGRPPCELGDVTLIWVRHTATCLKQRFRAESLNYNTATIDAHSDCGGELSTIADIEQAPNEAQVCPLTELEFE